MTFIEKFKEYISSLPKEKRAATQRELRKALTFDDKPAPPNEIIMDIIGEEETLKRIDSYLFCLELLSLALRRPNLTVGTTNLTKITFNQ